jgi:nucleotidyltransferase/DNA polymerase involved in DNA repair
VDEPSQPDLFGFLHIDLNSFFASVEQQLHPEYQGKPTAVVPTMADTTCCIAASYEAKALGTKTTQSIRTRSQRPSRASAPSPTPPPSTRWSAS